MRKDTLLNRHFGTMTVLALLPNRRVRVYCAACRRKSTKDKRALYAMQSCNCLRNPLIAAGNTIHGGRSGGRSSPEWISWHNMIARCTNPNHKDWKNYGGSNPPVKVCVRWRGGKGFQNFLADLGSRIPGTSLGRFADRGDYRPGNCAWQTWSEQVANRRSNRNPGGRKAVNKLKAA